MLSQVNIFLFLFTGLLLQTNPDGIGDNRLVFAVVVVRNPAYNTRAPACATLHIIRARLPARRPSVLTPGLAQGMLTTSIVVFSFMLFLRELWRQLLNALFDLQDEQDDEAVVAADAGDPEGGSSEDGSVHEHWDDGSARNVPPSPRMLEEAPLYSADGGDGVNGEALEPEAEAHGMNGGAEPPEGTPPPPSWVSRLAAPREA